MRTLAALLLLAQSPEAVYREGVTALEAGRAADAVPLLEKAATAAHSNAQYWKALGVALASLGRYSDALEPFREACALAPDLVDACYYYGRSLYATDRYEAALVPLRTALKADADKARAETAIAQALEALGKGDEAERLFRSAIGRRSHFEPSARLAFGSFLLRAGRLDEALAMLEAAQQPESAEASLEYARALMQAGKADAAALKLERLIQLTPKDAAAHFLLAKAYRRLGRNADAVRQEEAGKALQGSSTTR